MALLYRKSVARKGYSFLGRKTAVGEALPYLYSLLGDKLGGNELLVDDVKPHHYKKFKIILTINEKYFTYWPLIDIASPPHLSFKKE